MKQASHLGQQETYRRGCYRRPTDQRHHAVTVHGAVHLAVGGQHDPWHPEAGLADGAAAALEAARQEQGAAAAVALLEGAVLIVGEVVLRTHVARTATEAEEAGSAVPPGREEGPANAEERLRRR